MSELKEILVATDGSGDADVALLLAAKLSERFGSHLSVITVTIPPTNYAYGVYPMPKMIEDAHWKRKSRVFLSGCGTHFRTT